MKNPNERKNDVQHKNNSLKDTASFCEVIETNESTQIALHKPIREFYF